MEGQEVTEDAKPKKASKPRAPKAPAPPKSVEELVAHAIRTAATKPTAKWLGASAATLFNSKEANTDAAIKSCLDENRPLLVKTGTGGALTATGFELAAAEVAEEEVGPLAKTVATGIPLAEREAFIQGVIGRTPHAAAELTPLLAEIVSAAKAEAEAKIIADAKWKKANDEAQAALDRAKALLVESAQQRRDALRRQYEALGGDPADLPEPKSKPKEIAERPARPTGGVPVPQTEEEKDFRRYETERLAAAWRDAWVAGKDEGRDFLETAMWNIRGLHMIGEVGLKATFDGRLHECDSAVSIGAPVQVVRPGWLLKIDDENYVALKAVVDKV